MATETGTRTTPWERFYGPNLGYVSEQYEQYLADPDTVESDLRELFDRWGPPPPPTSYPQIAAESGRQSPATEGGRHDTAQVKKVIMAGRLARRIRTYGHLAAQIDPLSKETPDVHHLDLAQYDLSEADLRAIPVDLVWPEAPEGTRNGLEAIEKLRQIYTQSLAYEFSHVHDVDERRWLNRMVESGDVYRYFSAEDRVNLLQRLIEVEEFETFLHRTFVGQKRFSIEGVDVLVPMIDSIIRGSVHDGAEDVLMGMAHRGRLNVLANVLGKPYGTIFSEFHRAPNKELVPSEGSMGINYGWTGDVKYHMGGNREVEIDEHTNSLTLANNPSHLEFVNPVVEGFARAAQEDRSAAGEPKQDLSKAIAILVHGDAAFPGEGIVAETLNMSGLYGYRTGGTIHIIANNQLGFTTDDTDARSTRYASDLAKGYEIPIVHVNADDPEACLAAVHLAYQYRAKFHKDFLIDLIGYRRWGHNEMDDPAVTQPQLYTNIKQHPSVRELYAETLQADSVVTAERVKEMQQETRDKLQAAYDQVTAGEVEEMKPPKVDANKPPEVETGVSLDTLREMNQELLTFPKDFKVYAKLKRILERRKGALDDDGKVDWALAETLGFATILADGRPIRLTGQDTERGTFAHRHLVLHDSDTDKAYSPLQVLPQAKASFAIHNSPLSEASALGYEYGYNVFAPETLVLWEAQYGDFANSAQVIIDQFLTAGRAKWEQDSGLVLLLPHGYEGQGPEHSSARLERFLQLAAEQNCTIANMTTAAQYFHILRRQAARIELGKTNPLIIMSPKSLIRNTRTQSPSTAFSEGKFYPILEQPGLGEAEDQVARLVLCSGKVAIDLETELESGEHETDRLHIVRVEELYPFPDQAIKSVMERYAKLKEIVWVQEEPRNMGAWTYMEPRLRAIAPKGLPVRYIGRPERSSPAEGLPDIHNIEQERIVREALAMHESKIVSISGGNRRD